MDPHLLAEQPAVVVGDCSARMTDRICESRSGAGGSAIVRSPSRQAHSAVCASCRMRVASSGPKPPPSWSPRSGGGVGRNGSRIQRSSPVSNASDPSRIGRFASSSAASSSASPNSAFGRNELSGAPDQSGPGHGGRGVDVRCGADVRCAVIVSPPPACRPCSRRCPREPRPGWPRPSACRLHRGALWRR